MDVDSRWAALAVLGLALLLIVVLAAAEAALSTISRSRVRALDEQGVNGAATALRLIDDSQRMRFSLSLLNTLLIAVATGATFAIADGAGINGGIAILEVVLGTLLLQSVAAAAGARWRHRVAPALAPFVNSLFVALMPVRASQVRLTRRLSGFATIDEEELQRLDEEEMRVLASVVGDDDTEIAEEGREMIYSIVTLGQTTAREIMVPRPDIVALRSDLSMMEALDLITREGHSRIPVYDETIDRITGVLYAKDLLAYLRDGRMDVPVKDVLRPALFVPTSKMADELLGDLQRSRVHLAIVFDEYGGTAGLVTIEDVLEEIVGEIQDEYDAEEEAFVLLNEYEAIVSGLLDIDDLNHEMDLRLPTHQNDTVGGLIYSALGRVPLVGDEIRMEAEGVTFRVLAMVGRRISSVRVLVDHVEPPAEADGESMADHSANGNGTPPPEPGGGADLSLVRLFR